MLKAIRHSKARVITILLLALTAPSGYASESAAPAPGFKENEMTLTRDIIDQNVYYELTSLLRMDRLYRKIFQKKERSKGINVFDEVPDSSFFENRHSKERLGAEELSKGNVENQVLDLSGDLIITRGKNDGNNPGFFVKDKNGSEYLLKFDPSDNLEMETASEIIGSRLMHAIGYHVPQNSIVVFESSKLKPGPGAKVADSTGFTKPFTQEKLDEYMMFLPVDEEGRLRASASKVLENGRGGLSFVGRRRNDPEDLFDHEDRREIRALQVFASWLNNIDVRQHNSLDVEIVKNGQKTLKHYMLDLNASLGAAVHMPKPAHFGYEYLADVGETVKAFLGLGWWTKPWQKRWDEVAQKPHELSAVGYFDNNRFSPEKFKTQLPHYAFKDLTRADAFWAAKLMMSFTNDDVSAIVRAGEYSDPAVVEYITKTLIERRDIVARYWFSQSCPLDAFDVQGGKLIFENLAVKYSFEQSSSYEITVYSLENSKKKQRQTFTASGSVIDLNPSWGNSFALKIRSLRENSKKSPYVLVEIVDQKIASITHQD